MLALPIFGPFIDAQVNHYLHNQFPPTIIPVVIDRYIIMSKGFFYAIFIPFISDPKFRFHKSVDAALMLCAILLLIYIYLAERKIYLRELKRREGIEEDT